MIHLLEGHYGTLGAIDLTTVEVWTNGGLLTVYRKEKCFNRENFFGEASLRTTVVQNLEPYHQGRNPQSLDNKIIEPAEEVGVIAGQIECREQLSGPLRHYHRAA